MSIGAIEHHSLLMGMQRYSYFERQFVGFLQKLNIVLSYNLAVVLLGIYINELKTYVHMKSCTQMFITA